jgi:transposase
LSENSQNPSLGQKEESRDFLGDESDVRSDFHAKTTWGIRGETPVIGHTGKRFRLNMISAFSAKGELKFMTTTNKISAPVFIEFLKRLILNYPKKIFLIVNGSSTHKAKVVQRYLKTVKETLFFFPPYAPQINPDELVWNEVKSHGVGRTMIRTPGDLEQAAKSSLRRLRGNPEKVRSFFQKDTTRYAAAA